MATAPFQLWLDLAPIASAVAVGGTVTVATSSAHGMTPGAYVQVDGLTAAGTAFNTVAQVASTPSGTSFTYVLGSVSGTATVTTGCLSYDLLNPPINYTAGTARQQAMIAMLDSLQLSSNGDGSGASMAFDVMQENTPGGTPWFTLIPDNTRVRLCEDNTGTVPGTADVRFMGVLYSIDSQLTGSGQGSISSLSFGDVNTLLDRLGVFGQNTATRSLRNGSATRASNVTTLTFGSREVHGFQVGQQIKVSGLSGGGNASFNGIFSVASTPTPNSLTYANTGSADTSGGRSFTVTRKGSSRDRLVLKATGAPGLTANNFNLTSGDTIYTRGINGIAGSGWATGNINLLRRLANGTFSGDQVIVTNAYTIELVLPEPITGNWGTFDTGAYLIGTGAQAGPPIVNGQMVIKIVKGATEDTAIKSFLTITNAYKSTDYPLQRMFNTAGTAQISGGTVYSNTQDVQLPATTLRSALDAIVETYQGNDIADRRYFIDVNGNLNFKLVDATQKPTYATSPYSIVTASGGDPDTSTGKATVAPHSLSVTYDHETTKAAMFTIPATGGQGLSQVWAYTDLSNVDAGGTATNIFTERPGAPVLDAIVDFPTAVSNPGAQIQRAAAAYFTERHKPAVTITFEIRGAGKAAWNQYGFTSGYAQTGASTFALVNGWRVGQWCEIVAAGLGLNGLFRVEQVNWSLEPGTYLQRVQITANRKNPSDLATLIASMRS
jgi:hypothetical protein